MTEAVGDTQELHENNEKFNVQISQPTKHPPYLIFDFPTCPQPKLTHSIHPHVPVSTEAVLDKYSLFIIRTLFYALRTNNCTYIIIPSSSDQSHGALTRFSPPLSRVISIGVFGTLSGFSCSVILTLWALGLRGGCSSK